MSSMTYSIHSYFRYQLASHCERVIKERHVTRAAQGSINKTYDSFNRVLVVLVQTSQTRVLKYLEAFRKRA